VSSLLRRLPLSRLLLLCGVVLVVAVGATALALAVGGGPTPPAKPLAQAVHDALAAPPVQGASARIELTNHLIEGADLASGGGGEASQLASSPLLSGASGRLWVAADGHARLELQSEKGDTQLLWDGHTASLYDASTNTLYRYVPPAREGDAKEGPSHSDQPPTVAKIEEGIDKARKHADVSEATPTDVAGQAAYTVRLSPREDGGLIAGAELSWDAVHGVPLRAAVYSTDSSAPVLELAATEISYGQVDPSTLGFAPPSSVKVKDLTPPSHAGAGSGAGSRAGTGGDGTNSSPDEGQAKPHVTVHGKGLGAIVLAESPVKPGSNGESQPVEGLRKVDVDGTSASELPTALGTVLSFERAGVRYLLAGSVTPAAIEAFAKGL
jgi:outer membrane lipoprotein-sorting protein